MRCAAELALHTRTYPQRARARTPPPPPPPLTSYLPTTLPLAPLPSLSARLLREGEEELFAWIHPDMWTNPYMPGGSKFMRNPPPPLRAIFPDGIPEEYNLAPKDINGIQVPMSATPEGMQTVLVDLCVNGATLGAGAPACMRFPGAGTYPTHTRTLDTHSHPLLLTAAQHEQKGAIACAPLDPEKYWLELHTTNLKKGKKARLARP